MATIKDVALRAGVSTATVSYVINKSRFVSAELTRRVIKAIGELNFTPSKVAQSLRKGRTFTIGLITDDITNRCPAEFTKGLAGVASQAEYSIIISDLHEDPANEPRSITMLLDQKVDGIIYAGFGQAEKLLVELYEGGLPVIVVDKPLSTEQLPSVLIDNKASVFTALEYLKGLGRTDMVFINGLEINRNAQLRAEAFKEFLLGNGLPFSECDIIYGDYTLQHGYLTTLKLVNEGKRFSAIFCGDDIVAFGVMAALKARGIRIPEQVAVVGFDNDPIAPVFDPSLTTIHYPMYEMGRLSFSLFQKLLGRKRRKPEHIHLDTSLIIRRSTDASYREYQHLDGNP